MGDLTQTGLWNGWQSIAPNLTEQLSLVDVSQTPLSTVGLVSVPGPRTHNLPFYGVLFEQVGGPSGQVVATIRKGHFAVENGYPGNRFRVRWLSENVKNSFAVFILAYHMVVPSLKENLSASAVDIQISRSKSVWWWFSQVWKPLFSF